LQRKARSRDGLRVARGLAVESATPRRAGPRACIGGMPEKFLMLISNFPIPNSALWRPDVGSHNVVFVGQLLNNRIFISPRCSYAEPIANSQSRKPSEPIANGQHPLTAKANPDSHRDQQLKANSQSQ